MDKPLDEEWKALILEAKLIGLSVEDIRQYLQQAATTDKENLADANPLRRQP